MPRIFIDSIDDPRLDDYRHLARTNLTRWSGRFVAEGKTVVQRLIESTLETHSVLTSDRREADAPWLPESVTTYVVPLPLAQALVGFNFHAGFLACGVRPAAFSMEDFLATNGSLHHLTAVVCPDVNDPENVGAIVRIAVCFGVDLLVLGRGCSDPYSRRVLRVSMGTAFRLPILQSDDLARDLRTMRESAGFELIATALDPDAQPLSSFRRSERTALLLGNESSGLGPEWLQACDRKVTIPMAPGADSLNVAVAAGIFLHHFTRRQEHSDAP